MNYETNKNNTASLGYRLVKDEPPLYQVYIHNDDFTPMEFVIGILERFFYMERRNAAEIMLEAHVKGKALCGVFSKDCAETKISQVIEYARSHDHPLVCSMEAQ